MAETPSETDGGFPPMPLSEVVGISLLAVWIGWQQFLTSSQWVFLLDHANLALHEAGHPIVGLIWGRLTVYGGTIFQLLFPLVFAHYFRRERQAAGWAGCLLWFADSLINVGRYMKDARAQELPLVGSGDHDWAEIFGRWGLLAQDVRIGGSVRFIGFCLLVYTVWWLWKQPRRA